MSLEKWRYYSLEFISERLDVSTRVLAYWAQRGLLPGAIKFDGSKEWRVRADIFDAYLTKKHEEAEKWSAYISEPVARSTKRKSVSTESPDVSQLRNDLERALKKSPKSVKPRRTPNLTA